MKKNTESFWERAGGLFEKIGRLFATFWDKIYQGIAQGKDKTGDGGSAGGHFSIRNKIFISFLIPVVFLVIVGAASYKKAESGMRKKYEASTRETIKMIAAQVDLFSSFMKSEASRYAFDKELNRLLSGYYDDDPITKNGVYDAVNENVQSSQAANRFVRHIHIVTETGNRMFSTKRNNVDGFFEKYYQEMKDPANDKSIVSWIDAHPMLDTAVMMDDAKDAYIFSYQAMVQSRKAIVVIDASQSALQELLDGIDFGSQSVLGLVTMNGREIYHISGEEAEKENGSREILFAGTEYYQNALSDIAQGAKEGECEIRIKGKKYLFFYAPCSISGCVICAMVPLSTVTAEADSIKMLTGVLVVVALCIALAVGFVITAGIQRNVKRVSGGLGEVAKGDLTVKVTVTGRDEFRDLAKAATEMIGNTKSLVTKVDVATQELADSAAAVQNASDTLNACSNEISSSMDGMKEGMERQKVHAEECVATTDHLSDEIRNVAEQIGLIKATMTRTEEMIGEGVGLTNSLGEKAKESTLATDHVKSSVDALLDETNKINGFVDVIKSIASQTNLLSLNASIEAARAGEAGRGFAVVAEEIRKLATESSEAAGEIKKLVDSINGSTKSSSDSVNRARTIADEQFELVGSSIAVLTKMRDSMSELASELQSIDRAAVSADERRMETVAAVRNISDIIHDSAQNAEEVIGVLASLKEHVENLDGTADRLGESMDGLKKEVSVFKI